MNRTTLKWSRATSKKFAMIDKTKEFTRQVVFWLRDPSRHQEDAVSLTVSVTIKVGSDTLVDTTYQVFDPPALPHLDDRYKLDSE